MKRTRFRVSRIGLVAGTILFGLLAGFRPGVAHAQSIPDRVRLTADFEVHRLSERVWVHTSWRDVAGWGRVRSNGLVVVAGGEALLVDTAWGEEPTAQLLSWIDTTLGTPVKRAVVTHAHDDRMGGIGVLKRAGVPTYALDLTAARAERDSLPRPDSLFAERQWLRVGDLRVEAYFPGAGHTPDNVVVWLEQEKLLFGGCLVRDAAATSLGNLAEADVAAYPITIRRVMAQFGDHVRVVVPSHGPEGDRGLLEHTLRLSEAQAAKQPGG